LGNDPPQICPRSSLGLLCSFPVSRLLTVGFAMLLDNALRSLTLPAELDIARSQVRRHVLSWRHESSRLVGDVAALDIDPPELCLHPAQRKQPLLLLRALPRGVGGELSHSLFRSRHLVSGCSEPAGSRLIGSRKSPSPFRNHLLEAGGLAQQFREAVALLQDWAE
jgi:hypothetical protein